MTPQQLKQWRISRKLTMIQAAAAVRMSAMQWSRWETGKYPVPSGIESYLECFDSNRGRVSAS